MSITIHKEEDFVGMRKAGKLAAEVLDHIGEFVKPGVTTDELNTICHEMIIKNNAIPAPLNYRGFPKSICTSINHVVCHGIPDKTKLKNGDILNIDVTVIVDGWHGDTSRMFFVGQAPIKAKRLARISYECLMKAIELVKPGVRLGDIGYLIQTHAEKHNYSSVRDYCGHGLGRVFHTEPSVLHYGKPGTMEELQEGMFFTIEPMINAGSYETKLSAVDGWTVTTKDRELSAQFEHSIGVTKNGCEIFTKSPKGLDHPIF
jgi:methionyl aminopeptidase